MFRFQISLVLFIINGTAKTKVAILPFLCCIEFEKTSIERHRDITTLLILAV